MESHFLRNVVLKALALFVVFNLLWLLVDPAALGRLSFYNSLLRGRERFPYGENSSESYNLSLDNVDAMFASHRISAAAKPADEFRVIVIGDSSTWGTLLRPSETLSGQLDAAALTTAAGKHVRFYNLGYPTLSLTKDLMILQEALHYQPDLILWPVTLESFPRDRQLDSPISANNLKRIRALQQQYALSLNLPAETRSPIEQVFSRTLIGQRRDLADLLRLQLYGVMESATGIDQAYPTEYPPAARDLEPDTAFNGWAGPHLDPDLLSWDVLAAGIQAAGDVPVIIINEPVLVSSGKNSNLRYNFYYPRWAYDDYRTLLTDQAAANGWHYLDLWNCIPQQHFTNTAIHLDPAGVKLEMQELVLQLEQYWK